MYICTVYIGLHYDPNLACSPNSQNASTGCITLGRVSPNYAYNCTQQNYAQGKYSYCEVGDISGKNGNIYPSAGTTDMFALSTPFTDYQPPYAVNYGFIDTNSLQWTSFVFHCAATGARLVCGKLSTTNLAACQSSFDSFALNDDSSSDDDGYSTNDYRIAVAVSVVICLLGGIFIGVVATRKFCGSKSAMSSNGLEAAL